MQKRSATPSITYMLAIGCLLAASALIGCSILSSTAPPTSAQVQEITNACAIDAGVRPAVTALEALATPAEVAGITAARAIIDPICANPSATSQTDAITAFTAAVTQVVGYEATLSARKAATPPK